VHLLCQEIELNFSHQPWNRNFSGLTDGDVSGENGYQLKSQLVNTTSRDDVEASDCITVTAQITFATILQILGGRAEEMEAVLEEGNIIQANL